MCACPSKPWTEENWGVSIKLDFVRFIAITYGANQASKQGAEDSNCALSKIALFKI